MNALSSSDPPEPGGAAAGGDVAPESRPEYELTVGVSADAGGWADLVPGAAAVCRRMARAAILAGMPDAPMGAVPEAPWEIGIALAGDADIRPLNRRWRGKDTATNVLSFPAHDGSQPRQMPSGEPEFLGDVMLAFEICAREADEAGVSLSDHLSHLIVHGVLHLLGYDHEMQEDAERMERLETEILARAGIPDPYAGTEAVCETVS